MTSISKSADYLAGTFLTLSFQERSEKICKTEFSKGRHAYFLSGPNIFGEKKNQSSESALSASYPLVNQLQVYPNGYICIHLTIVILIRRSLCK